MERFRHLSHTAIRETCVPCGRDQAIVHLKPFDRILVRGRAVRRGVVVLLLALACLVVWWGGSPARAPLNVLVDWTALAYDDRENGEGRSEALWDSASGRLSWILRSGVQWPYAGVEFLPPEGLQDLSGFQSLQVQWISRHANSVAWTFKRDVPGLTVPGVPGSLGNLRMELSPPTRWSDATFPLDGFEVPLWWFSLHGRDLDTARPARDRIRSLSLGSGETARQNILDTLEITSIRLVAPARAPWTGSLAALGLVVLAVLWHRRLRAERSTPSNTASEGVVPSGEPSTIPPARKDLLWSHLATRYRDADLDLPTVARDTGLGEHRIGEILRAEGLTFRTALNAMRLQEARRLLRESELQVSEIAWQSGFGNVSHFNRVFKSKYGTTPTEARLALRESSESSAKPGSDDLAKPSPDHDEP